MRLLGEARQSAGADEADAGLYRVMRHLKIFFCLLGFCQHSVRWFLFSWTLFLLLGVLVPTVIFGLSHCSPCGRWVWSPISKFEVCVMASEASLAAVSLFCVSHSLRKRGIRKLLFVRKSYQRLDRLQSRYVARIKGFFRVTFFWVLPGLVIKTSREILRLSYVYHKSEWQFAAMLLASVLSWTYLTLVFLSGCNLFSLSCNLQVIHFEEFGERLQQDTGVSGLVEEHSSLCYNISKISHRFRVHLLLVFLISVGSQFVSLLLATQYAKFVDFTNAGIFAACATVEVTGIVLCLNAATRLSHWAQRVASIASRWHVLATCRTDGYSEICPDHNCKLEVSCPNQGAIHCPNLGPIKSDTTAQVNENFASFASLQYQRQAFVMYLQSNISSITIYGWSVDRALINTIFAIELSLVLFVFGRML